MTRRKDPGPEAAIDAQTVADEPTVSEIVEPLPEPSLAASDVPDPHPEPMPDPAPPRAIAPPESRQSGLFGTLLGGALAAVGGFALSHFNVFGLAASDNAALTELSASVEKAQSDQAAALAALDVRIVGLTDRLSAIEAAPAPAAPDLSALDAFDQRLAAVEAMPTDGTATSSALAAKVAELERRFASVGSTDTGGLQDELASALARLDKAEAAATAQAAEAEVAAASAKRSQALDALGAAIADGRPFAAELEALSDDALSASLGPMAAAGVSTLATLQADFPDAAREVLRVARDTNAEDGWSDRLVDFLAGQTGARPVTPQEGSTPEAILSRAEFALSEGRVADALAELAPLDPAIKAPLDGWIAAATAQVSATVALAAARGE